MINQHHSSLFSPSRPYHVAPITTEPTLRPKLNQPSIHSSLPSPSARQNPSPASKNPVHLAGRSLSRSDSAPFISSPFNDFGQSSLRKSTAMSPVAALIPESSAMRKLFHRPSSSGDNTIQSDGNSSQPLPLSMVHCFRFCVFCFLTLVLILSG
jgi:hypothetical protein